MNITPPCPEAWKNVFLTDCIIIMKSHSGDELPRNTVLILAANDIMTAEQLWNTPDAQLHALHRMTGEMASLAIRLKAFMSRMGPIWLR